jgi:hypothetical protein
VPASDGDQTHPVRADIGCHDLARVVARPRRHQVDGGCRAILTRDCRPLRYVYTDS